MYPRLIQAAFMRNMMYLGSMRELLLSYMKFFFGIW